MNKVRLPSIIALLAALVALAAFFLPYISATEEYAAYIDTIADQVVYEAAELKAGDLKNISIFAYAKTYIMAGEEIFRNKTSGYIEGGAFAAVGVFALLTALWALGRRPILTFINNALMGGAFYLISWDVMDRSIMPDSRRFWGISHQLYYPLVAIIGICAIWMFVAKHKAKKQARAALTGSVD